MGIKGKREQEKMNGVRQIKGTVRERKMVREGGAGGYWS